MKKISVGFFCCYLVALTALQAVAHPGGLDKWGGHWDKAKGEYHFHSGPLEGQTFKTKALALKALRMELNADVIDSNNDYDVASTENKTHQVDRQEERMLLSGGEKKAVLRPTTPSDFNMQIPLDKVVSGYKVPKDEAEESVNNVFVLERNAVYKANVGRVVDGDTIIIRFYDNNGKLGGTDERVRMIGVDTPETVHPRKGVQFYGPEASFFTKQVLSGADVWIQTDVGVRDRYDRVLGYVWISMPNNPDSETEIRDKMFNAKLLLGGYAQVFTVQPNSRYAALFVKFQNEARRAKKGMWKDAGE